MTNTPKRNDTNNIVETIKEVEKVREARRILVPYGLLEDEKEAIILAQMCQEANDELSIIHEVKILHMLFRRPPNILGNYPLTSRKD